MKACHETFVKSFLQNYNDYKKYWNYEDGCVLKGCIDLYQATGDSTYRDFVMKYLESRVMPDGTIPTFDTAKFNIDSINCGKALYFALDETGDERYRKAIDFHMERLQKHPRCECGNFWHKESYPYQIWLDGLYMAQPFYMEWEQRFDKNAHLQDITTQFKNVRKYLYDEEKHLSYHAFDEKKVQPWCNKETGKSPNFWLRSMGWYLMALVDCIGLCNEELYEHVRALIDLYRESIRGILPYADPETGLFYQVIDYPKKPDNYLETSGSAMIIYALLKGVRLGIIDGEKYLPVAMRAFESLEKTKLREENGAWHLGDICSVAGLGPGEKRDGSVAYYLSEPIVDDDSKGVGPYMMALAEYEKAEPARYGVGCIWQGDNHADENVGPLEVLFTSGRSVTLCLQDGGLYTPKGSYRMEISGKDAGAWETATISVFGLIPDTHYTIKAVEADGKVFASVSFRTKKETVSLNVLRFGAVGDGVHDDTPAIQAAINCCPAGGRVLIPAGDYKVMPLFMKSHTTVEIQKGATLHLCDDRKLLPIMPGMVESTDTTDEYSFASWEGNPMDSFASMITGYDQEDISLIGEGVLDGCGNWDNWWGNHRVRRVAWRPRMVFVVRCKGFTMQGLSVKNSPAWNLQPYFSQELKFLNVKINAPADSPNTDGFDPESCKGILFSGVHFSVGDDCIALKSGKIYMGAKYATPCEDIAITHCLMEDGHGGVTAGSEMAGGIKNVFIRDCLMRNTDRGLRLKTRRGRGRNAVIDNIVFENVVMENVGTPLVANERYFCDPDGKSEYVQTTAPQPVDERTPCIGSITFRNVQATGVACAAYLIGLPEKPIEHMMMENVSITCGKDRVPMAPAMANGVEVCSRKGIVAQNVERITLKNVTLSGYEGEEIEAENVAVIDRA